MQILIVSSTFKEISKLFDNYNFKKIDENLYQFDNIEILISDIGIHSITYHLTKQLSSKTYDIVINAGIAGSFNESVKIGDVVNVSLDCFADLGIESKHGFKSIFEHELADKNEFPFTNGMIINKSKFSFTINAKSVLGITVNSVSGTKKTIELRTQKIDADIESMEGAAFAFVCENLKIPYLQIRSISNMIDVREKQKWDIELAIENLNAYLIKLLSLLQK